VTPDPRVLATTRRQPEYGRPFGDYLNSIASKSRIATGARKAAEWETTLAAVERQFGVESSIVLGLWGIESSYGGLKSPWDVVRSLATLAHARFRAPYFRNELLVVLKLLQDGEVARADLRGSWAGAMGQPQFMPSSFLNYAVDFSGDGRRDIWDTVPDVLGSMANYLRKHGWQPGVPWGFEVVVPVGFDHRRSRATFDEWRKLGLSRADGRAIPDAGSAILFFPSGAGGPAFLVTRNFEAIKTYNNSDVYAVAVGHLADRIRGGGPVHADWPADDVQLARNARIALQKKLAQLGYPVRNFEGHLDFALRDVIRTVQSKLEMVADGHPTSALLERLGVHAR
jgi:lytic murein transglycosylase